MKILLSVFLLLPGLVFSPVAMSQAYSGLALGVTGFFEEAEGVQVDDEVLAGMFYAGMRLSSYAALELSYLRSGSLDYYLEMQDTRLSTDLDFHAWIPSIHLRLGSDQAAFFASIGMAFWDVEVDLGPVKITDDDTDPAFGFGFEYQPEAAWGFRVQYIFIGIDGSSDVPSEADDELNTLLLGAQYRF